jgi:hypothetical protein
MTPKVIVSGGSWVGDEEGGPELGLLDDVVGTEDAEPGDEPDESHAASIPVPRRAAVARRVAPRVRLALARTAKTLVAVV